MFCPGAKSLCDVLSGVAKNGMGCFVPGCFVWLPDTPYGTIINDLWNSSHIRVLKILHPSEVHKLCLEIYK